MRYRDTNLILDNFRTVLKDYSVDIQDIVRSAILDGIDISDYIGVCKNNPSRLEQIRLAMKEGINPLFFNIRSSECLYKIRKVDSSVLSVILSKIKSKLPSEDIINILIDWVSKGYNIENIDVFIIPKTMYSLFDQGLSKGFDMSYFNDGRNYSSNYIRYCLTILSNDKDISVFTKDKDKFWNEECLKCLSQFSKIKSKEKWASLINNISVDINEDKLSMLISCVQNGINIKELGKEEWNTNSISLILQGYDDGVDYNYLISLGPDVDFLSSKLNELILKKSKRVSGRLRKR